MIFNRYIAILLAGTQSLCYPSSLRSSKGRQKPGVHRPGENHQLVGTDVYDSIVSLLTQTYNWRRSCTEVTIGDRPGEATNEVSCKDYSGYAALVAL